MIVGSVRSGVIEARHPIAAVAVDREGVVIASLGDEIDRDFYLRSAPKPLQAAVSQRYGADLVAERLAVAAASHSGFPVHIAYVTAMLLEVGLDAGHLRCPPDRPLNDAADRIWASMGRPDAERIFHNCSGKHAAMLRACVASDWSLEYTAPDHPLQQAIVAAANDAAGRSVEPTGVDGCGIPTLRCDTAGLARLFGRLVTDPEYAEVAAVAARHAPLTADGTRPEAVMARWVPAVVKGGAQGSIGLGMLEHGLGFAAKSWTGVSAAAVVGLIELMDRVGVVPEYQRSRLERVARPPVLGGGRPVGSLQPVGP